MSCVGPVLHGKFCQILWASSQKLRGLPQQSCPNSVAHRGLLFVSKLSYKNCSETSVIRRLALCSVMLATYKNNYQSFF